MLTDGLFCTSKNLNGNYLFLLFSNAQMPRGKVKWAHSYTGRKRCWCFFFLTFQKWNNDVILYVYENAGGYLKLIYVIIAVLELVETV